MTKEDWKGLSSKFTESNVLNKSSSSIKTRRNSFEIIFEGSTFFVHSTCALNTIIHGLLDLDMRSDFFLACIQEGGDLFEMTKELLNDVEKSKPVFDLIYKYNLQDTKETDGLRINLDCHTSFSKVLDLTLHDSITSRCNNCQNAQRFK